MGPFPHLQCIDERSSGIHMPCVVPLLYLQEQWADYGILPGRDIALHGDFGQTGTEDLFAEQ